MAEIKNAAHRRSIEQLVLNGQLKWGDYDIVKGTQKRTELKINLPFNEAFNRIDHWSSLWHWVGHSYFVPGSKAFEKGEATFSARIETRGRHRRYTAYLTCKDEGCLLSIRNDF